MKLAVKISALVCFLIALCLMALSAYAGPKDPDPRFFLPGMIFGLGALALAIISTEMKG